MKIGVFDELQSNGQIARSWMRYACTLLIIASLVYLFRQLYIEKSQMDYLWDLLIRKVIDKETYMSMKGDVIRVNWETFFTMLGTGVAGKVIQKFGESKSGSNTDVK